MGSPIGKIYQNCLYREKSGIAISQIETENRNEKTQILSEDSPCAGVGAWVYEAHRNQCVDFLEQRQEKVC